MASRTHEKKHGLACLLLLYWARGKFETTLKSYYRNLIGEEVSYER
jgi:hypothetical protein